MDDIKEKFKMIKVLGRGNYGEVWKVERLSDKKIYALKLIDKNMNPEKFSRIKKEIEMMKIITATTECQRYFACLIDTYDFKDVLCILMEYIEGISLFKYFETLQKDNTPIDPKLLKKFMIYILTGLDVLHRNGIVHRDIKDDNILFNNDELKIVDFGFACYFDNSNKDLACKNILGTPAFMAPEVWTNEGEKNPSVYPKSDIWAAGLIFWELVSLKDAPDTDDFDKLIRRLGEYDAEKMNKFILKRASNELLNTTEKLRKIILLCVNAKPEDRPSAKELLKMLKK